MAAAVLVAPVKYGTELIAICQQIEHEQMNYAFDDYTVCEQTTRNNWTENGFALLGL